MEVSELRIGNLVDLYGTVVTVFQIRHNGIDFLIGENEKGVFFKSLKMTAFKPVLVTDERLLQCGFIPNKLSREKCFFLPIPSIKCEIHVVWFRNNWVVEIHNHVLPLVLPYCELSLHMLQNLYFSLTQKELKIDLQFDLNLKGE